MDVARGSPGVILAAVWSSRKLALPKEILEVASQPLSRSAHLVTHPFAEMRRASWEGRAFRWAGLVRPGRVPVGGIEVESHAPSLGLSRCSRRSREDGRDLRRADLPLRPNRNLDVEDTELRRASTGPTGGRMGDQRNRAE